MQQLTLQPRAATRRRSTRHPHPAPPHATNAPCSGSLTSGRSGGRRSGRASGRWWRPPPRRRSRAAPGCTPGTRCWACEGGGGARPPTRGGCRSPLPAIKPTPPARRHPPPPSTLELTRVAHPPTPPPGRYRPVMSSPLIPTPRNTLLCPRAHLPRGSAPRLDLCRTPTCTACTACAHKHLPSRPLSCRLHPTFSPC